MEKMYFDKIPQHLELMKSLIQNQTIQKIYSKFEFLYYSYSIINLNNSNDIQCQKTDSFKEFLLNYLINYKFVTYCFKNKEKNKIDLTSTLQLKDFIVCVENKCIIIEDVDEKIIDEIINNMEIFEKKLINIDSDSKETKEEIKNFSNYFSYDICNNDFLKLTFNTIAGFLIKRFYCPTDYFNDHSFFIYPEYNKIKKDDEVIKNSIEQYFDSEIESFNSFIYLIHSPREYINFHSQPSKPQEKEKKYYATPFGSIPEEDFEDVNPEEIEKVERDANHMIKTLTDPFYYIDNGDDDDDDDDDDEVESKKENQKYSESNYEITPFGNIVFDDENDDFDDNQSSTSDEENFKRKKNFESSSISSSYDENENENENENDDDSHVHQDFIEKEFIILRKLYHNEGAIFYLVFHIKSFYIFVMKKVFYVNEDQTQINHEIYFCQNYSHRCFTQFYGFLKEKDKIVGFIYEFMSNDSLFYFINSHKNQIDEMYLLMTINRIVQAIEYLHSNSLIYRDLKPKNILIDHDFIPYISDFETIRHPFNDESNDILTGNIGSIYYSSPEQDRNNNVSYPSDIYSFGLTIYFLYKKKNLIEQINSKLTNSYNNEILPINNCSEKIQNLYKRCVQYNQFDRPKIDEIKRIVIDEINSTNIILNYITDESINFNESNLIKFISEKLFLQIDEVYQLFLTHEMLREIRYIVIGKIVGDDLLYYSALGNYYYKKKMFEEARKCFETKPNLMNHCDLYKLGRIYYEGLNVQQDFAKAKQYFFISAERGNANSLFILGLFFMNGISVDRDYFKARKYFEKAVEKEQYGAYLFLGDLYLYGYGVPCDYTRAKRYYEVYTNKMNLYGNYKIGKMYENGLGVKKNYLKAKEYYERADNSDAFLSLGHLYKNGYGVKKNYKKARLYYEKASDMKNSYAMNCLGELYEKGLGVKRNYLTAHFYYKLSAKSNNPEALFYLGYYYSTDNVDISKAIEYYMKCHEIHYEKIFTENSIDEISSFYFRLNHYYYRSSNDIGLIYLLELYDIEKSIEYIKESALNEYIFGQNNYGILCQFYLNNNTEEAQYFFQKASQKKFSLAFYNLGYLKEKEGKIDESIELFIKAIENENEPLIFQSYQHFDKRLEISKAFIICITNLKLASYYFSKKNYNESKKYFINAFSKLKINSDESSYQFNFHIKKKNKFSYLKEFILGFPSFNLANQGNFDLNEMMNSKFTSFENLKTIAFDNEKEKITKSNEIYCKLNKSDMNTLENGDDITISNPGDLFDLLSEEALKSLFENEINEIVQIMNTILYTKPYNILFGRLKTEIPKPKPKNISNSNFKDINEVFYEGIEIDELIET